MRRLACCSRVTGAGNGTGVLGSHGLQSRVDLARPNITLTGDGTIVVASRRGLTRHPRRRIAKSNRQHSHRGSVSRRRDIAIRRTARVCSTVRANAGIVNALFRSNRSRCGMGAAWVSLSRDAVRELGRRRRESPLSLSHGSRLRDEPTYCARVYRTVDTGSHGRATQFRTRYRSIRLAPCGRSVEPEKAIAVTSFGRPMLRVELLRTKTAGKPGADRLARGAECARRGMGPNRREVVESGLDGAGSGIDERRETLLQVNEDIDANCVEFDRGALWSAPASSRMGSRSVGRPTVARPSSRCSVLRRHSRAPCCGDDSKVERAAAPQSSTSSMTFTRHRFRRRTCRRHCRCGGRRDPRSEGEGGRVRLPSRPQPLRRSRLWMGLWPSCLWDGPNVAAQQNATRLTLGAGRANARCFVCLLS